MKISPKNLPTEREIDILKMLAAGMTNQQIARSLRSPLSAVEKSIRSLCRKIGASNEVQLGGLSLTSNLIEPYYFCLQQP